MDAESLITEAMITETRATELERRLKLIEDKQAIHDAIMRYCRGVDRGARS